MPEFQPAFDAYTAFWSRPVAEPFFPDLVVEHRRQIGGRCVSTGLSLLTGEEPDAVRAEINTQDPVSWSCYLQRMA